MTARETVLHRICRGRPDTSRAWGGIVTALDRYEPAVHMFCDHPDWTSATVWQSAIGQDFDTETEGDRSDAIPNEISASHILAIIDLSALWVNGEVRWPGQHGGHLVYDPTWLDGVRTDVGASFDLKMKQLNVFNWRAGVDIKFHRRYYDGDG